MGTALATAQRKPPIAASDLVDWQDIVKSRAPAWRMPGALTIVAKSAVMAAAIGHVPAVDVAKMCATAIVTTTDVDRQLDVIETLGIQLENYRKNPVVLYDHGLSGITVPIAKCENHDGELDLKVFEDRMEATSWFTDQVVESRQIFSLIDSGLIRTASIRVLPISSTIRDRSNRERPGLLISESEMAEWSWVAIPMNPAAVRKCIDGGKLFGEPICEPILKMLTPWAAQCAGNAVAVDVDLEPEAPVSNAAPAAETVPDPAAPAGGASTTPSATPAAPAAANSPPATSPAGLAKSATAASETAPKPGDGAPSGDGKGGDGKGGSGDGAGKKTDEDDGDDASQKPSAKHLAAAYKGLINLRKKIDKMAAMNEHAETSECLKGLSESLDGHIAEVVKCYGSVAKGAPELKDDMPEDGEAESLQKFLADGSVNRMRLVGLVSRIETLGAQKNLNDDQRSTFGELHGRLTKMLGDARRHVAPPATPAAPAAAPAPVPAAASADVVVFDQATGQAILKALNKLGDLIPNKA